MAKKVKRTIKKGHHRPYFQFTKPVFNPFLERGYFFTENCWWWFNDPDKDGDWSKLMGFVPGFRIHNESYRFGMRPTKDGQLEFAPYIYQNGKRLLDLPTKKLSLKKYIKFNISDLEDKIYFYIDDIILYSIPKIKKHTLKFSTNIYIGGGTRSGKDWTAPHDITIYELK